MESPSGSSCIEYPEGANDRRPHARDCTGDSSIQTADSKSIYRTSD